MMVELGSPKTLDPQSFLQRHFNCLNTLAAQGLLKYMFDFIVQAVTTWCRYASAVSYIYLLDYMAKHLPAATPFIHQYLPSIFVGVWLGLSSNTQSEEVRMKMKLMRKLWLAIIPRKVLEVMRSEIYSRTGEDIDVGFDQYSIDVVSAYYR